MTPSKNILFPQVCQLYYWSRAVKWHWSSLTLKTSKYQLNMDHVKKIFFPILTIPIKTSCKKRKKLNKFNQEKDSFAWISYIFIACSRTKGFPNPHAILSPNLNLNTRQLSQTNYSTGRNLKAPKPLTYSAQLSNSQYLSYQITDSKTEPVPSALVISHVHNQLWVQLLENFEF